MRCTRLAGVPTRSFERLQRDAAFANTDVFTIAVLASKSLSRTSKSGNKVSAAGKRLMLVVN